MGLEVPRALALQQMKSMETEDEYQAKVGLW